MIGRLTRLIDKILRYSAWGMIMPFGASLLSYLPPHDAVGHRKILGIKLLIIMGISVLSLIIASWKQEDGTNDTIFVPSMTCIIQALFIALYIYTPSQNNAYLEPRDAMFWTSIIIWSVTFFSPFRRAFL